MNDETIEEFMHSAGFKTRHRGYEYIKFAIKRFLDNDCDSRVLGGELYKELARVNNKTSKTIEKNITCAIESVYLRGDMEYLSGMGLIFDNVRGRPTNCEFIATSAVNLSLKEHGIL